MTDSPPQDSISPLANGGIEIRTVRDADFPFHMEWTFDPSSLPAGTIVSRVVARVCGHGSGDFYEIYGPYGTDPVEYEVTPPAADGCWHFVGEAGDYNVTVYAYGDATLTLNAIEMVITSDR